LLYSKFLGFFFRYLNKSNKIVTHFKAVK
jgi:hypothetical protein